MKKIKRRNNRVLTNRHCRRNNKQDTANDKRRFSNKKNVVHREDCSDGRNETKRERGVNTSDREKQISAKTTEAKQDEEQVSQEATANQDKQKLEQMKKKLICSEQDRKELKKEVRHNKKENLDNYYVLASATEEKLQQMEDKVETTDKEQEKHIKIDMEEMKKRYDTVSENCKN